MKTAAVMCGSLLAIGGLLPATSVAQVFVPQNAVDAQDNALELRAGVGRSDNVLRNPNVPDQTGTFRAVGVLVDYNRPSSRLDISVAGDVEFRDYSTSGVDNVPYGILDADITVHALPDRIRWVIADDYGQGRTDPFRVNGPANREQINAFSTGPEFDIPLGERTAILVSHLVGTNTFEDTSRLDSDTDTTSFSLLRAPSSTSQFGLVMVQRDIDYEVNLFNNEISDAYLMYDKTLSSGFASVQLGSSEVDFGNRTNSAPFVSIGWERDLTARSSLRFLVDNRYQDAAETFRIADIESFVVERADDVLLTADVFERSSAGVAYLFGFARSSFEIGVSFLDDVYENSVDLSNEQVQLNLRWQHSISPRMQIRLDATSADREFVTTGVDTDDTNISVALSRVFSSRMSVDFFLNRSDRSGINSDNETSFQVYFNYGLNSNR